MLSLAVPAAFALLFAQEIDRAGMRDHAALLAAQIADESSWDPDACSGAGACGLAQFEPSTWADLQPKLGPECAAADRTDPRCSIRALCVYMGELLHFVDTSSGVDPPVQPTERYSLALASYDAGLGNILKERRSCKTDPLCYSGAWEGNVADKCLRSPGACEETQNYVRRIMEAD